MVLATDASSTSVLARTCRRRAAASRVAEGDDGAVSARIAAGAATRHEQGFDLVAAATVGEAARPRPRRANAK
jgi:hypothetical protein